MISSAVLMKIAKMTLDFFAKNWKAFLVAAVLGVCLWIFCDWRAQAAEISALEYELKTERQLTRQWRDVSRHQSEKALEAALKRNEFEKRLADLLANPPVITKWKKSEPELHEIIVEAKDCQQGIIDVGRKLKGVIDAN
jgi:uncharacterized membrane protein